MSKTKVWIIGAQGRLGSTISDALDRMAYNVLTSDMDVDITDMDSVTAFMDMSHPVVVINCAGYKTHNWLEEDMVKAAIWGYVWAPVFLSWPIRNGRSWDLRIRWFMTQMGPFMWLWRLSGI